jgi:hypothetical protein
MANEQNLIPFTSEQSQEEAKKNGSKGGIASGIARRKRKMMREDAQMFLEMPLNAGQLEDVEYLAEVKGKNITVQQAILLAMIKKAMKGDVRASEYVRDTAGQQIANININTEENNKFADILKQLGDGGNV